MKSRLSVFALVVLLIFIAAIPATAASLDSAALRDFATGPCAAGATYDPACDVNQDNLIDVVDVQLTAGHWNQTGPWTGGGDGWLLTGNAGTDPTNDFVGTTDGQPLAIQPGAGNVGIGTTSPQSKLSVDGTGWFQGSSTPLPAEAGAGLGVGFVPAWQAGYLFAFDYGTYTPKKLLLQSPGGKVGIGVSDATPLTGKLQVSAGAGEDGVRVDSAGNNGLFVNSANNTGVYVGSAGNRGVYVNSAAQDGIFVGSAGNPSSNNTSSSINGFEVTGAQGSGLYVGRADATGVDVHSAGGDGVYVFWAGGDGVGVLAASNAGIDAAGDNYAGYFAGNLFVTGTCTGCRQANFAINAGDRALQPGDVVSIKGIVSADFDTGPALWQVTLTQPGQTAVGVVAGRAELVADEEHRPTENGKRLVPRDGATQPSEYVTVVYSGPMQVKVAPGESAISAGTRVAAAADGTVRALGKIKVQLASDEGTANILESAPVIGVALEAPKDGLVWVLVNPQ